MGLLGTFFKENPDWQEAVERVLRTAKEMGKPVGIHATSTEEVKHFIQNGFQFIALSTDAQLLRQSLKECVDKLKDVSKI